MGGAWLRDIMWAMIQADLIPKDASKHRAAWGFGFAVHALEQTNAGTSLS